MVINDEITSTEKIVLQPSECFVLCVVALCVLEVKKTALKGSELSYEPIYREISLIDTLNNQTWHT